MPGRLGEGPDERAARDRPGELAPQGADFEPLGLLRTLRARREAMGPGVAEVWERSGPSRRGVDALEGGRVANPRIGMHHRHALALDAGSTFGVEAVGPAAADRWPRR